MPFNATLTHDKSKENILHVGNSRAQLYEQRNQSSLQHLGMVTKISTTPKTIRKRTLFIQLKDYLPISIKQTQAGDVLSRAQEKWQVSDPKPHKPDSAACTYLLLQFRRQIAFSVKYSIPALVSHVGIRQCKSKCRRLF